MALKDIDFMEEMARILIETNENLATLDPEVVLVEQAPEDKELISGAFRTFHTVKETFGFGQLGAIATCDREHSSQAKEGTRVLTPELVSLVLSEIDRANRCFAKATARAKRERIVPSP